MLKKGDRVVFSIGSNETVYEVEADEYERFGVRVVDLIGYHGEVNIEYLRSVG